jgi:uncharacterized protein YcbX
MRIATIAELWRYPVKGMRGEQLQEVALDAHGIAGDRRFAIRSTGAPRGKPLLSGAERATMLLFQAVGAGTDTAIVTPDGRAINIDDPHLLDAMQNGLPGGHTLTLLRSDSPMTDVRPVALLGRETVDQLSTEVGEPVDARRFRANILLQFDLNTGFAEDKLVGHTILLGETAKLRITERDPRCRIVILDPTTAAADPALMKHLDRHHEGRVGVYGVVEQTGMLRAGGGVELL